MIYEPIKFLPDEFSHRSYPASTMRTPLNASIHSTPVFCFFTFRQEKFMWNDKIKEFKRIEGLENTDCQQLLENFSGLSDSKRQQMYFLFKTYIYIIYIRIEIVGSNKMQFFQESNLRLQWN